MNLEEAINIFAPDGILHLASANRKDNIAKILIDDYLKANDMDNPELEKLSDLV